MWSSDIQNGRVTKIRVLVSVVAILESQFSISLRSLLVRSNFTFI